MNVSVYVVYMSEYCCNYHHHNHFSKKVYICYDGTSVLAQYSDSFIFDDFYIMISEHDHLFELQIAHCLTLCINYLQVISLR